MDEDVLKDVCKEGLKVVFCGTAVGAKSAIEKKYYAGNGNLFWETIFRVGFTDICHPESDKDLLNYGIGLTDLVKHKSGNDLVLTKLDFDQGRVVLERFIEQYHPKILAFTGKCAAKEFLRRRRVEFGLQTELFGNTRLFVLPSPSGLGRRYWSVEWWEELKKLSETL